MPQGRVALVVGIDTYPDYPLQGCVNDAVNMSDALTLNEYGYAVTTLFNESATRRALFEALNAIIDAGGESLIIYFAGHGQRLRGGSYLMTIDGTPFDPGISLVELGQWIETAGDHFAQVVTILDSCHAGAATNWTNARPLSAGDVESDFSSMDSNLALLAACRPEQKADEAWRDGQVNGAFTRSILDGLLGYAVDFDGNVTITSLFDYTSRVLTADTQTPVFKGDISGNLTLGSGFEPRAGTPIQLDRLGELTSKAEHFVRTYQSLQVRELSEIDRRRATGLDLCARQLSEVIRWFEETQLLLPDLARDSKWKAARSSLQHYQASLSQLGIDDRLPGGRIVREVGSGGFGRVYAVDPENGQPPVAYKVFHGADLNDRVKPARFRNGFHSMRALSHPRIVRVHELTEAPFGFSMDLIEGSDLRDTALDRRDAGDLLRIVHEISDTVRFAHGSGVIHRDIKPENVIMGWDVDQENFTPYITDFDLAYIETNQTVTVNLVGGVINYAAPEQFYQSRSAVARSERVDVYALAQLVFFIVCGHDPRADRPDENARAFSSAVAAIFTPDPAAILIDLYRAASSIDPSGRPASMTEFTDNIQRARARYEADSSAIRLDTIDLMKRVAHLYVGPGRYEVTRDKVAMTTRAGTLAITLLPRGNPDAEQSAFSVELRALSDFSVPGASSGAQATQALNAKLDRALNRLNAERRSLRYQGYYGAEVFVPAVTLDNDGVTALSSLLNTVIGSLEGMG